MSPIILNSKALFINRLSLKCGSTIQALQYVSPFNASHMVDMMEKCAPCLGNAQLRKAVKLDTVCFVCVSPA